MNIKVVEKALHKLEQSTIIFMAAQNICHLFHELDNFVFQLIKLFRFLFTMLNYFHKLYQIV